MHCFIKVKFKYKTNHHLHIGSFMCILSLMEAYFCPTGDAKWCMSKHFLVNLTFSVLFFSFVLTACNLFKLWWFFQVFDKRAINTARMRWFYLLICKYDCWRGFYCLRWRTLSSHKSFNSKRFDVFDHSETPAVFALSEKVHVWNPPTVQQSVIPTFCHIHFPYS